MLVIYRRPNVRVRIGHDGQMIGDVRRMRILCASLQQTELLLGAVLLRCGQRCAIVASRVRLDAAYAQAVVDQSHHDVSDDGLRAARQLAVVAR